MKYEDVEAIDAVRSLTTLITTFANAADECRREMHVAGVNHPRVNRTRFMLIEAARELKPVMERVLDYCDDVEIVDCFLQDLSAPHLEAVRQFLKKHPEAESDQCGT